MKTPNWRLLATAAVVSTALTACGGSNGDDGKNGNPGRPGGEPATTISQLNLALTDVSFDNGLPVFKILATNEEDESVVGLQDIQINVAQLLPAGYTTVGDSTQWQFAGDENRNGEAKIVDEKNGYYSVTFSALDKADLNPDFTRRLNIVVPAGTLSDGTTAVPNGQASFDYNAAGASAGYTRNIVTTNTCAACHGEGNGIHHPNYIEPETCATCHDGLRPKGGRTNRAFTVLVHDVHQKPFAEESSPVDRAECNICHLTSAPEADVNLAEWGNWSTVPSKETCSSCHSNNGHINEQPDSSLCATCHTPEGSGVVAGTIDAHQEEWNNAAKVIGQWGTEVQLAHVAADDSVNVTVSILDAAGTKLNASEVLPNIERLELTTNVGPSFPVLNYNQKSGFNAIEKGKLVNNATISDGNIVANTGALAFGNGDTDTAFTFVGLSACSKDGQIIGCEGLPEDDEGHSLDENYTGMKANLAFVTKSGGAPSMRHSDSLDITKCIGCHNDNFQIHKNTHPPGFVMDDLEDGLSGCVACHTPEGTYSYAKQGAFEQKLHVKHYQANPLFVEEGKANCQKCHTSFNLDAFDKKGVINTGIVDGGSGFNPADARYGTPITATCGSCHDEESEITHMTNGAPFGNGVYKGEKADAQLAVSAENCLRCHVPVVGNHRAIKKF